MSFISDFSTKLANWTQSNPPEAFKPISNAVNFSKAVFTSAASTAKDSIVQSYENSQLPILLSDLGKAISDSVSGMTTSIESAMASALDAEFASAAKQMAFQEESNEKAMKFTADQNELNRIFQQNSADKAMKFTADQAQISRDWQENMSNTSYQRAIADMQAAGLNPILAVTQGGASTPAGAAGTGYAASGSSGSGVASAGSKADAASGKNADTNYLSIILNSAASLLHAVGEIIPG